jgi:hypothetical protein
LRLVVPFGKQKILHKKIRGRAARRTLLQEKETAGAEGRLKPVWSGYQATLVIFPERMQRVQTLIFLTPLGVETRTF